MVRYCLCGRELPAAGYGLWCQRTFVRGLQGWPRIAAHICNALRVTNKRVLMQRCEREQASTSWFNRLRSDVAGRWEGYGHGELTRGAESK